MKIALGKSKAENEEHGKKNGFSLLVFVFSVLFAFVFWFYVQDMEAPDYKKTFTSVKVELQNLSPSFSVVEGGSNTVDITLIGKRSELNRLRADDLEAYVDLSEVLQPGNYQHEISVLVPEGAELFDSFPQKISLFLDQTISKSVPIKIALGNYTIGENMGIEATPALSKLQIKGPKTVLDQVHHVLIRTGNLGEISSSFEGNMSYILCDENGVNVDSRHVVLPESNMRVKFSVYKTKQVPLCVQYQHGVWNSSDVTVTVNPKNIWIKGEPMLVDSVNSVPCLLLDEKKLDSDFFQATVSPAQLLLPDGVRLGEVLGDIRLEVELKDNGSRNMRMNLSSNHVVVTPPKGALNYRFTDTHFEFKIRGNLGTIYTAEADDFYLNVDLSAYSEAGTYQVPVELIQTSESERKFYPVGTYTLKVEIE